MTEIRDVMIDLNPWWKGAFRLEYYEREIYKQIQKFMPLPQIIAFTGLRRVGKTTLMLKIVEDAIADGFEPWHILFFSFDEFRNTEMREVIKTYEQVMAMDFREGQYLLLLDEVQKLNHWEDQLKGLYDIYKEKVKIVISGSESLFIEKKSRETLAGRLFDFKVDLLSFPEFLRFKGADLKPIDLYERELRRLFDEFVLCLGFPELVGITEKAIIKKYVQESIIQRIVYKDIPTLFNISDVSILESILNILMADPGQLTEFSEWAKEFKISRQTISTYFKYLEQSFLIKKIYNFSRSQRKSERKLKKFYPAVVSLDLLFKEDTLSQSKVFEWLMVSQLDARFFWRDSYKNEVDMILGEEEPIPVEIKYGKLNFKGLATFMSKFNIDEGFIVSYEVEDEKKIDGRTIHVIPAFKYLLKS